MNNEDNIMDYHKIIMIEIIKMKGIRTSFLKEHNRIISNMMVLMVIMMNLEI